MLKIVKKSLLILLMVPLIACADADAPFREGEHYVELSRPVATGSDGKIEVVELFWYGCPHCFQLEPRIERWLENKPADVEFKRMPAVLAKHWEVHARAYYASALLGVEEKTHGALFDALHKERQRLFDQVSLAGFYAKHGVDEVKFNQAFKSFSVNSKIQQAKSRQRNYQATGVPAIIVNGKYRVGTTMKAGDRGLFDVVDYLIKKERSAL